jgi:L-proline amide hydrolase
MPAREGFLPFRGYRTWYRLVEAAGPAPGPPLLVLHGGPGAGHSYLTTLERLARSRPVVFYDQLGCGNSDHPEDESLWSVDLFLEELRAVRAALGLERVHVLGHSWGGMLAMEYACSRPAGLLSLTVASAPASMAEWVRECRRLLGLLPPQVREVVAHHERAGTTADASYVAATMEFYRRHVCRLDPWPAVVASGFLELMGGVEVYRVLNGPSEFHVTGRLRDWTVVDRLAEIQVPTLITSGRHDEATPAVMDTVNRGIAGSERVTFSHSAHLPHVEESARYCRTVGDFLRRADSR